MTKTLDLAKTLPAWTCHKEVRAAKILEANTLGGYVQLDVDGVPTDIEVHPLFFVKHNPQAGGYLVRYEDGYMSYSPAAAFESGYVRKS